MFIKTSLKIQKMLKEVEIVYRNASRFIHQNLPIFTADVRRTQGLVHVINILFKSYLGKA